MSKIYTYIQPKGKSSGTVDVVDSLNSTSTSSALSAKQGKVLDNKINTINTELGTKANSNEFINSLSIKFLICTQEEYDLIATKDENTLYFIKEV